MNKHLLAALALLFVWWNNAHAQCPPLGYPIPGDSCPVAPVITCLPLDGYCNTLDTGSYSPPIPGCQNGATFNNADWIGFVAGTTTISILVSPSACLGSVTGHGLQSVLLGPGCSGPVLDNQCNCGSAGTNAYTLSSTDFIVGETYFMAFDGCGGDTCFYELSVTEGSTLSNLPELGPINGLVNVCPGATTEYFIEEAEAAFLTWTLTPPIGTFVGVGLPVGEMVTIAWNTTGQAQLCPTVNSPCYPFPQPPCLTISSAEIMPQHQYYDICNGECQECAGTIFCESTSAAGTAVSLDSWLGCDSVIVCHIHEFPAVVTDLGTITFCSPASYEVCGQVYWQSGIYSTTCTDFYGCDSMVEVNLAILEPVANISPPGALGCGQDDILVLDGLNSSFSEAPGNSTTFEWSGPGIVGVISDILVVVNEPGEYCLTVTHSRDGMDCSDTECVTVEYDHIVPQAPQINGNASPCMDSQEQYFATVNPGIIPISYSWITPNGEPFTQLSFDLIQVNWNNPNGGQLCVVANSNCGASLPGCLTISLANLDTTFLFESSCNPNDTGVFIQNLISQGDCDSTVVTKVSLSSSDTTFISDASCDLNQVGVFQQMLSNQYGCDSLIITTVSLLPSDTTHILGNTCDAAMAGIFTNILTGQNGCDSVIVSTILLDESNTTHILGSTCDATMAGIFTNILTGQNGCDSLVIENISLAPSDTTHIFGTNCDPTQTGVFEQIWTNQFGCDSVVISTIIYAQADTTAIFTTTCDAAMAGIFTNNFTNQNGCDSLVIENISLASSDTTFVTLKGCDPSQTGVFEQILPNQNGCDSVVISTIVYSQSDTTNLFQITCDAAMAGVFTHHFTNQNGCDSVIIENISLAPSDTTYVFDTSCEPVNTGIFQQIWTNQYGCDSTVILSVSFAPSDTTMLVATTCDAAAAGEFWQNLTSADGCDSVVQTTVTWLPSDTIFITLEGCDPAAAGVFTQNLTNQNGCDSMVVSTVTLLPSDTTLLFDTNCNSWHTGTSTNILTNQFGCDSTVISTVVWQPDTILVTAWTCDPDSAGTFSQIFLSPVDGCDLFVITTLSFVPSDQIAIASMTCDPNAAGVFVQYLTNQYGCDSVVTEEVNLLPGDETSLFSTTCDPAQAGVFTIVFANQYGCDSIITETVSLLASDTTFVTLEGCDPAQAGTTISVFSNQKGCDSLVVTTVNWTPPPSLSLVISDFNGFEISCAGGADGSVSANATGAAPFSFAWSNPDGFVGTAPEIMGLSAGNYSLVVTDANGCTASASATLEAPQPLQISFMVNDLNCFKENEGAIFVEVTGGAAPLRFSLDGVNFQASNAFENLPAGAYQITALDANDCETVELILIQAPLLVTVELGEDLSIELGNGTTLTALVNVPFDSLASVIWTGLDSAECPNCLTQPVFPLVTTSYSVSIAGENGCWDEDDLTVFVDRRKQVFVPNAFSPNDDGVNDVIYIFAKPGVVKNVRSFLIFDRWGESVFSGENLQPNDPAQGWDGKLRGEALDPATFAWWMEIEFLDGQVAIFEGDFTLMR